MADLIAFLRARYDEEERAACAATPGRWRVTHDPLGTHVENGDGTGRIVMKSGADRGDGLGEQNAAHIARHDPARVLRDIEAKRQVVQWARRMDPPLGMGGIIAGEARKILKWLALPYADHVDYREGWLSRLTDPHPQDEHCKTGDLDHCMSHGVDEGQAGAYRVCLECGHAFPSAAALLADHAALVERLNAAPPAPPSGLFGGQMAAETDPERIRFCPHCAHDF